MSVDEGSTFAGKSTEETIENYAEVMLDNIQRGRLSEAITAWEKAKEIDFKMTIKVFEGPYSAKIAHAYATHVREKLIIPLAVVIAEFQIEKCTSQFAIPHSVRAIRKEAKIAFTNAEAFNSSEYEIWVAKAEFYLEYLGPIVTGEKVNGKKIWQEVWDEEEFDKIKEEGLTAAETALKLSTDNEIKQSEANDILEELNKRVFKNESPCFIATAAYGTPFNDDIDILRTWRDNFLMKSFGGKKFVKNYYLFSPPIANLISKSTIAKNIVRNALKPVVKILEDDYS